MSSSPGDDASDISAGPPEEVPRRHHELYDDSMSVPQQQLPMPKE